jgi:glycosyltransferase A (GT-A) superfamily protein (DUF2064 family)
MATDKNIRQLFVVTKVPKPGRSKTRLARVIGDEKAAEFARCALLDLCENLHPTHSIEKVLLFAPAEEREELSQLLRVNLGRIKAEEWTLLSFDTGEPSPDELRMGLTFEDRDIQGLGRGLARACFKSKAISACFIGMDTPQISGALVDEGFSDSAKEAFIAPAEDGGYVLLRLDLRPGIDRLECFAGIRWSTQDALTDQAEAISRAGGRNIHVYERKFRDVDEFEDFVALGDLLSKDPEVRQRCPRVAAFIRSVLGQ